MGGNTNHFGDAGDTHLPTKAVLQKVAEYGISADLA